MKQWYEELFENYGVQYDREIFTQGTTGECDFIEQEVGFNKKINILDIGCGTGRHLIELAKRGYSNLTGVDLSESLLTKAREKAATSIPEIRFIRGDARHLTFQNEFDLVIMICEGAFPLMETDEMNFQILQNAAKALKNGGKLIFTTLNGFFPLFHSVKKFLDSAKVEGNAEYDQHSFDLMTLRDKSITLITDDAGKSIELQCNERYYLPSEITWLLKSTGFNTVDIYGAKLGAFSRDDKLTTEDFEMLVIAEM
jgi:2-polyprenyl-3-methyl-5-hydroxy-6-metoxy-1,4-benzoquinol methylase